MHVSLPWLVLLFPVLGSALLGFFGRAMSKRLAAWVGCGSIGLAFATVLSIWLGFLSEPAAQRVLHPTLYAWLQTSGLKIPIGVLVDPLSVLFMLIITGVGFFIHVYSVGYMAEDEAFSRYFSYMNLFVFSMLLLVMSDNFLFLLVGWGAVGLASYLLIGFWYHRPSAVAAAKKAFVINVFGDVTILIAIFLIVIHFHTLSYLPVFSNAHSLTMGGPLATWIAILLYVGAAAKSAQFPLHLWLPDAMEGPTPVSALIHAATMVTAGVYLIARCYPLFHQAPAADTLIAAIGGFTAFMAATIGLVQPDIKRVLAYSTVSQLGYMFMAVGTGSFAAGLFHFTTHGFFKALLFLGAGSVIHAMSGEQDLGKMGGLGKKMPVTYWTMLVACLAISGIPGFAGFFSKDEILGNLLNQHHVILWLAGVITAGLTSFYIFRLFYLAFAGDLRSKAHPHESPKVMTIPLVVLAVPSALAGYLAIPGAYNAMAGFLHPVFAAFGGLQPASVDSVNLVSMVLSALLALAGWYVAYLAYKRHVLQPAAWAKAMPGLYQFLLNKWYIDEVGEFLVVRPAGALGVMLRRLDDWAIDGFVRGVAQVVAEWGESLRPLQTGYVRRYALSIFLGVVAIAAYLSFKA